MVRGKQAADTTHPNSTNLLRPAGYQVQRSCSKGRRRRICSIKEETGSDLHAVQGPDAAPPPPARAPAPTVAVFTPAPVPLRLRFNASFMPLHKADRAPTHSDLAPARASSSPSSALPAHKNGSFLHLLLAQQCIAGV